MLNTRSSYILHFIRYMIFWISKIRSNKIIISYCSINIFLFLSYTYTWHLIFTSFIFERYCTTLLVLIDVVTCRSVASAFHHSSRNGITLVPIFDQLWTLSLDVLWTGWRLKSHHAATLQGRCGALEMLQNQFNLSVGGSRHRKKGNFSRVVFPAVAAFTFRGEITRTTQQNWRKNLWSRAIPHSNAMFRICHAKRTFDVQRRTFAWRGRRINFSSVVYEIKSIFSFFFMIIWFYDDI